MHFVKQRNRFAGGASEVVASGVVAADVVAAEAVAADSVVSEVIVDGLGRVANASGEECHTISLSRNSSRKFVVGETEQIDSGKHSRLVHRAHGHGRVIPLRLWWICVAVRRKSTTIAVWPDARAAIAQSMPR